MPTPSTGEARLGGREPHRAKSPVVLEALPSGRAISVCSREWRLLEPFENHGAVRVVYSVGTRAELEALFARPEDWPLAGVSIHHRLLDEHTVAELRRRTALVPAWRVASDHRAHELIEFGVDRAITSGPDDPVRYAEPAAAQTATGDVRRSSIGT